MLHRQAVPREVDQNMEAVFDHCMNRWQMPTNTRSGFAGSFVGQPAA